MGKLLSMTGYGNAKGIISGQQVTVELKSVNNRYLDTSIRLPRNLLFAEDTIKKTIADKVSRGKVDVFVTVSAGTDSDSTVAVDMSLAGEYCNAVKQIAEQLHLENGLNAFQLSRFPDVLSVEKKELDKDEAGSELARVTSSAIDEFNVMREREGQRLKEDLLQKASNIEKLVSVVEERSPQTVNEYKDKLLAKLNELLKDKDIDEQRVLTEVAIFADKTAVDEETVRLRSHLSQFRKLLDEGSPIGRKLDFLVQEFNRESNTIGSKCNDAELAQVVVELKCEIEKIREQIQNIE